MEESHGEGEGEGSEAFGHGQEWDPCHLCYLYHHIHEKICLHVHEGCCDRYEKGENGYDYVAFRSHHHLLHEGESESDGLEIYRHRHVVERDLDHIC